MVALTNILLSTLAVISYVSAAPAVTFPLTFDTTYDINTQSLVTISCSYGTKGLLSRV